MSAHLAGDFAVFLKKGKVQGNQTDGEIQCWGSGGMFKQCCEIIHTLNCGEEHI